MMTEESPHKVLGLLSAALLSMSFLFAVTVTNASFSRTEQQLPDVFGPQNVMSVLDSAANNYSKFVAAYLVQPAQSDLAYLVSSVSENAAWVMDNADETIVAIAGLDYLTQQPASPAVNSPGHVAGVYTSR